MSKIPDESARREAERRAAEILENLDPTTEMADSMIGMHELYTSMRAGGFSEYEALWLVGYIVCGGTGKEIDSDE